MKGEKVNKEQKKRVEWIDITRGIGIVIVVLGHCNSGRFPMLNTFSDIFSLPLFFILAGYLYKPQKDLIKHFFDKVRRFLLPFVSIFFLVTALAIALDIFTIEYTINHIKQMLWGGILWWHNFNGYFTPMWFLACMFLTQILYNVCHRFLSQSIINIIAVLMLIGGYLYQHYTPELWFPWYANNVLIAFPLYNVGYIMKIKNIQIDPKIIYLTATLILIGTIWFPMNHHSFVKNYYGIPIITFVSSIFCSLMIIEIAKELSKRETWIKGTFMAIGVSSLVILGFHMAIYYMFGDLGFFIIKSDILHIIVFTLITICISHTIYILFNKNKVTQLLFLGSKVLNSNKNKSKLK